MIKNPIGPGNSFLGVFRKTESAAWIKPVQRKNGAIWQVRSECAAHVHDGELVEARPSTKRSGIDFATITKCFGPTSSANSLSLIAVRLHEIELEFSGGAIFELNQISRLSVGSRADLREIPFITIDPENARDRDDAIFASKDLDPANPGGFLIWIAIADVAHFVRPNSRLDRDAKERGNSTYFPDFVAPMLPEELSNGVCSLQAENDRLCIASRITLNASGKVISKKFVRGIMRSVASLTYREAQDSIEKCKVGQENDERDSLVQGLFEAYESLKKSRELRSPLDLEIAEGSVAFGPGGNVVSISRDERLESHRLVEEFMIVANVCAAEILVQYRTPFLFRIHDSPAPDKLDELRTSLKPLGLNLPYGPVPKSRQLNRLIDRAKSAGLKDEVCGLILRAMSKAGYAAANSRHYGLNLDRYAHFTSPIRRYADLLTHRALISALDLGNDGLSQGDINGIEETALHVSATERKSMLAERETLDRFAARYLSALPGVKHKGKISSVARFGVFVRLDDIRADGLLPISKLSNDNFRYDEFSRGLTSSSTRSALRIGTPVTVTVAESDWETGMVSFNLESIDFINAAAKESSSARMKKPSKRSRKRKRGRKSLSN